MKYSLLLSVLLYAIHGYAGDYNPEKEINRALAFHDIDKFTELLDQHPELVNKQSSFWEHLTEEDKEISLFTDIDGNDHKRFRLTTATGDCNATLLHKIINMQWVPGTNIHSLKMIMIDRVLSHNPDLRLKNEYGKTAFFSLLEDCDLRNDLILIKKMIALNPGIADIPDNRNGTPLFLLLKRNYPARIIEGLLSKNGTNLQIHNDQKNVFDLVLEGDNSEFSYDNLSAADGIEYYATSILESIDKRQFNRNKVLKILLNYGARVDHKETFYHHNMWPEQRELFLVSDFSVLPHYTDSQFKECNHKLITDSYHVRYPRNDYEEFYYGVGHASRQYYKMPNSDPHEDGWIANVIDMRRNALCNLLKKYIENTDETAARFIGSSCVKGGDALINDHCYRVQQQFVKSLKVTIGYLKLVIESGNQYKHYASEEMRDNVAQFDTRLEVLEAYNEKRTPYFFSFEKWLIHLVQIPNNILIKIGCKGLVNLKAQEVEKQKTKSRQLKKIRDTKETLEKNLLDLQLKLSAVKEEEDRCITKIDEELRSLQVAAALIERNQTKA